MMNTFLALLLLAFIVSMFCMYIYGIHQAIWNEKVSGIALMWLAHNALNGELVNGFFEGLLGN